LGTFAIEIKDELRVVVAMWLHFLFAVAIELQFAQHETERVNFNLLN
jgi:hypothetical protein